LAEVKVEYGKIDPSEVAKIKERDDEIKRINDEFEVIKQEKIKEAKKKLEVQKAEVQQ
jgi:hypothetical protein